MFNLFNKKFKKKNFYTCDEIKEMLIEYHENKNSEIKKLNKRIKYFAPMYDYHALEIVQEYDILEMDEKNNTITFTDSCNTDNTVLVQSWYQYFSKDDIAVEYYSRTCMYGCKITKFGLYQLRERKIVQDKFGQRWLEYQKTTSIRCVYENEYEVSGGGHGIGEASYRPTRERYDELNQIRTVTYMTSNQPMKVYMYSDRTLLRKKYLKYDLKTFDSSLLKSFTLNTSYLETTYNEIKINIELDLSEKKIIKHIQKMEDVLVNSQYNLWLHAQIKGIYKLYKDWYDEDIHGKQIKDIEKYEKQYYPISIMIENNGSIHVSYMDKCDSFLGHRVHISIGSKGKISKFEI